MTKVMLICMSCKNSTEERRSGIIQVRIDMIDTVLSEYENLGIRSIGQHGKDHVMNTCIYCRRERKGLIATPRNEATLYG